MTGLLDKMILLLFCSVFAAGNSEGIALIFPLITALTITSLAGFFNSSRTNLAFFLAYFVLCLFFPSFLYFAPLVCYDIFMERFQPAAFLLIIPFAGGCIAGIGKSILPAALLTAVSFLLKNRAIRLSLLLKDYIRLRDEAKEFSNSLEHKNKELLEKQDYEANLAALNERNRIAGEIHDNVGHLLSSSILQIGALIITTKDPEMKESLCQIKDTLSTGMNSIRNSIHNIHDESIDLYTSLRGLDGEFIFCKAVLEYDVSLDLYGKARYAVLFIVKEALNNVMKHSDATEVRISLMEHPGFYQLVIADNGRPINGSVYSGQGMGLNNITKRIDALDGCVNINTQNGFKIFISLPKENPNIEDHNYR
ncbi:sensor histidine kinase [Anaerobium acetethylicum]|uniref:histidine kinase n=1 Tax=Anaerobium acetethylicum TaxID=1619234 RepID=A0A1D3TU45_9FIRM|nr:histidine kinase [Anaerobium acetethylicum]SCP97542.1 Signal transduction histidine kinase [Anaerobium acetethylicum]